VNSKERVKAALAFEEPDRVPTQASYVPEIKEKLRQIVGDEEVKRLIKLCAPGGGFILTPAHNIQADTSVENILAFYDAAKEYGKYPIRI